MPCSWILAHLKGDCFLQNIKQELELQQGCRVCRVGGQREEPVLFAPGQQVLLKHPGELLQAGCCQGQCAAAIQHQVTWKTGKKIISAFYVFSTHKKNEEFLFNSQNAFPSPFKSLVLLFLQHLFVSIQQISVPLSIKLLPLRLFPPLRKSFIFRGLLVLLKTNFKLISLFCFDYVPAPVLHLLGLHLHSVSPIIQLCTRCQSIQGLSISFICH